MRAFVHILLFLFFGSQLSAQNFQLQKDLIFGGTKTDQLIDVIKIPNSNDILVAGISNSTDGDLIGLNPTNVSGIILFRTDSVYRVKWKLFIPDFVNCSNLAQISSNTVAVLGTKRSFRENTILTFNLISGSIVSTKVLPPINSFIHYEATNIKLSFLNERLVAALEQKVYEEFDKKDIILYALNTSLDIIWTRNIKGSDDDDLYKLFTISDKIYIWINSNSYNYDYENKKIKTSQMRSLDIWLFELNLSDGQINNRKQIGNNWPDYIIDTELGLDGFYALLTISDDSGDFYVKTTASLDNVICKIDFSGNVIWQKNTGSSNYSTIEVLPNQDILISSLFAMRRFTKDGNFIFYQNTYPLINPVSESPSFTISESIIKTLCYYTKYNYSGVHLGKEIYLSTLVRTPNPIELETISKTWVCLGENIQLKIDTNIVFNSNNRFIYKLRNIDGIISNIGESTSTEFNFSISNIDGRTVDVSMNYVLMIESTNPVSRFEINNLKVQGPLSNYLQDFGQVPSQINRGELPTMPLFYQKNYKQFPTKFTINGEQFGFMDNIGYPGFQIPTYKGNAHFYIEKVEDLCGVHYLNQKKTISVIDDYPNLVGQDLFGGSEVDIFEDMIIDNDKNIYLVASSSSKDHDLTNPKGGMDIFLVKVDSSGNVVFKKSFGGTNNDYVKKMKLKSNGNIVLIGVSFSTIFEGVSIPDISETGFLAEITSNGDLVWVKKYGYVRPDAGNFYVEDVYDLLIDSYDNIYTCGAFDNYFGVRRHSPTGEIVWQSKLGSIDNNTKVARALGFDNQGNIIVVGNTTLVAPNYKGGVYDILMAKYHPNGSLLKTKHFGGSFEDRPFSLITTENAVYMSGITYSGDKDFPNDNFQAGQYFLYKTSFDFDSLWVKTIRQSSFPQNNSLTKGPNNSILMTANLYKYWADSSFKFTSDGTLTIFNFSENGDKNWIKNIGGPMYNNGGKVIYYKDSTYLVGAAVGKDFQEITNTGDIHFRYGKQDVWLGQLGKGFNCKDNFTQKFPQIVDDEVKYKNTIKLNNSFQPGGYYRFDAGQNIELLPGTQIDKGVTLELKIGNCGN